MAVSFRVRVAWAGSFAGEYDDITAYVRTDEPIRIQRGFSSELDRIATIGTAYLAVTNVDQRFTPPGNSPLTSNVVPMKMIIIEASPDAFVTTTWPLFRGYIKRIRVEPGTGSKRRAWFECEDALGVLERQRFAQPLQENRTADQLYTLITSTTFRGASALGYILPDGGTTQPNNGDTCSVGDKTYTFKTSISAAYDVLIGTTVGATFQNLTAAINNGDVNGDGLGTIYGDNTIKSNEVSAEYEGVSGTEVVNWCKVTALYRGTLGNAITLTANAGGRVHVSGATLSGGTDAPAGLYSHETGQRTYTIAMDQWSLENTNAGQALEDVALSEYGWVYVNGAGVITTKSYDYEFLQTTQSAVITLDNTHADMDIVMDDDLLFNRVTVTNTPRREVSGAVIARANNIIAVPGTQTDERWNQDKGLPGAGGSSSLSTNTTVVRLPFTDSGTGQVVGAKDVITPQRGTDYNIYENADGSGFNYTTNPIIRVMASVVVMGSGVEVTFTNTATGTLYVDSFQVRGTRIEQYDPQSIMRENAASITAYGERSLEYNLPLDAGDLFPTALANYLLSRYKTPALRGDAVVIEDALELTYWLYVYRLATANLVAYWRLNESVGVTAIQDSGPNGYAGSASGATLGEVGIGDGDSAASFDGTNDYINVYSAGLAGAFNGAAGTLMIWAKVSAVGVWTDGTNRSMFRLSADTDNVVHLWKPLGNNLLEWRYTAGGTVKSVNKTSVSTTGWFVMAITWSKVADEVKAYYNGVQEGSTQTGLGTWAGSLANDVSVIGSRDTVPTNPWSGILAHAVLWNSVLTAAQIAALAQQDIGYLMLDIGDRLDLVEDHSGISARNLIRRLEYEITAQSAWLAIQTKSLADVTYWILQDATYGVLGSTTCLGL